MPDDPLLSYYGQPILPAGYNADDNNGDEVDGAGTNWAIWPTLIDLFIGLDILIITPEMLAVFDGCADYAVPHDDNYINAPGSVQILPIPSPPSLQVIDAADDTLVIYDDSNVIVFPAEDVTVVIVEEGIAA